MQKMQRQTVELFARTLSGQGEKLFEEVQLSMQDHKDETRG